MNKDNDNMTHIYGGMRDFLECPKCGCPWFTITNVVALDKKTKKCIRLKINYRCDNCNEVVHTEDKSLE